MWRSDSSFTCIKHVWLWKIMMKLYMNLPNKLAGKYISNLYEKWKKEKQRTDWSENKKKKQFKNVFFPWQKFNFKKFHKIFCHISTDFIQMVLSFDQTEKKGRKTKFNYFISTLNEIKKNFICNLINSSFFGEPNSYFHSHFFPI